MGSKKLKAVAVARGKTSVIAKDKAKLSSLSHQMLDDFKKNPSYIWGTSTLYSGMHASGALPVKNLTTNLFAEHARFMGDNYRSRFEVVKRHPLLGLLSTPLLPELRHLLPLKTVLRGRDTHSHYAHREKALAAGLQQVFLISARVFRDR